MYVKNKNKKKTNIKQIFKRIRIKISKCTRYDIFKMEIPI